MDSFKYRKFVLMLMAFAINLTLQPSAYGENLCSKLHWESTKNSVSTHDIVFSADPRGALSEHMRTQYDGNYEAFAEAFYKGGTRLVHGHLDIANWGLIFLGKLRKINPSWEELIVHPGLVQRQTEFLKFADKKELRSLSADEVYNQFSEYLGRSVVYRALAINTNVSLKFLQQQPLLSKSLEEDKSNVDENFRLINIYKDLSAHTRAGVGRLPLSVSNYPEVALAVASSILTDPKNPTRVVLFKLSIPTVEIIAVDKGPFDFGTYENREITVYKDSKSSRKVVGVYKLDRKVESIVLGGILPSEILSVQEVKQNYSYDFERY